VEDESSYSIRQFAGKEILLPVRREWWPERGKVEWHREWVGKTQAPNSKLQIPRGILMEILLAWSLGVLCGIFYCELLCLLW
jgi:hypothetical protein